MPDAPPAPDQRLVLTAGQTAEALGISVRSVYNLVAAGALPVVKFGRASRFDRRDLETLLSTMKTLKGTE